MNPNIQSILDSVKIEIERLNSAGEFAQLRKVIEDRIPELQKMGLAVSIHIDAKVLNAKANKTESRIPLAQFVTLRATEGNSAPWTFGYGILPDSQNSEFGACKACHGLGYSAPEV